MKYHLCDEHVHQLCKNNFIHGEKQTLELQRKNIYIYTHIYTSSQICLKGHLYITNHCL